MEMKKIKYYPESKVEVTAPFFMLTCGCGFRSWSLLGNGMTCPKCGEYIKGPMDPDDKKRA